MGGNDANCPKAQWVDYGFMCKSYKRAFARVSVTGAMYSLKDLRTGILAHEQIGHIFARLDDEYEETSRADDSQYDWGNHYNCTSKERITPVYETGWLSKTIKSYNTKWGNMDASNIRPGCNYSKTLFYRSSENSLMRDLKANIKFETVNERIIEYKEKNYPNLPTEWGWGENFKYTK